MRSDSRTSNRRVELQLIPDMSPCTGAWRSLDESVAAMLSASLTTSGCGPVIDALQASVLLSCSEGCIGISALDRVAPGQRQTPADLIVTDHTTAPNGR